jgi:hypothetical protein
MKHGRTTVVCVLSGALLAPAANAASNPSGNNYDTIAVSNPFRLKPIPPPQAPPVAEIPQTPASTLILQGITDILGQKMAMLEVQPPNNAPKTHMTMSEGERIGDIEVVSIDVVAGIVQVKNQGIPKTLDFSAAAKAVASSLPSATIPAATPLLSPGSVLPLPTPVPNPASTPAPTPRTVPLGTSRQIRTGNTVPVASGLTPMVPTELPSIGGVRSTVGEVPKDAPITPEEQIIIMEVNRELTKDKGYPPLPPTPVTPVPPTP